MFYKLLNDSALKFSDDYLGEEKDTYRLGGHLMDDHSLSSRTDFDISCNIFILKNSSPRSLEVNEHLFIEKLRTLKPNGINSCNPFNMTT